MPPTGHKNNISHDVATTEATEYQFYPEEKATSYLF